MTPTVTVIVPTRNRPQLVGRAVESILAQTFTDFEVILVDNNAAEHRVPDGQGAKIWLRDSRVRLLEAPKARNAAGARNAGLRMAQGEWVTYLDDDDAYAPRKLEWQLAGAVRSGLPLGLCGMVYHVPCRRRVRIKQAAELSGDDLLLYFPGMPTMFHRRNAQVCFDESLNAGEDQHYFHKLVRYYGDRRIFNVPEPLVDVYQQDGEHVNLDARAVWQSCDAILREFGGEYSEDACRTFQNRARLRFCMLERGHLIEMAKLGIDLVRRGGLRDTRLILNGVLCKSRWMRRWLVH